MECRQVLHGSAPLEGGLLLPLTELKPHLVLAFGSVACLRSPGYFAALQDAFPGVPLVGCSTAGEISNRGVSEQSCVVTAVRFHGEVGIRVAEATIPGMDSCRGAGVVLGAALQGPNLCAVLLFAKGVGVNGSAILAGLASQVGGQVPITGGLAGDDGAFLETLTLGPSGTSSEGAVAVGLYGTGLVLTHGSCGGWAPFGPARKVTRSRENILYELDGEPALNVYKRYLGEHAKGLPNSGLLFPLELLNPERGRLGLIRTILGVDEAEGYLVLAGDVEAGGYLRLMHASTDDLVDGAEQAAELAGSQRLSGAGQGLALLVSCVGRRLVMGDAVGEEIEVVGAALGKATTLTGFYSYGEFAPLGGTECKLHNQTMTVTCIGER
ncbi:MAG: FIST C-terminal domain-containing protein [Acidobacteria bacterium]|nr:FIST C-terminal domain-containing protein [Acidobacteriota bacterium]